MEKVLNLDLNINFENFLEDALKIVKLVKPDWNLQDIDCKVVLTLFFHLQKTF